MSKDISFRRGADLNLNGKAEKKINENSKPNSFAIQPNDFFSLFPKLIVREGEEVSKGSPIFYDKKNSSINFVSPVSGIVSKIIRVAKRKIESIIIENDGDRELSHNIPENLNRDNIIELLTASGCWPFIRQRPYNIIANPKDTPKIILISCFTSAPLDVDFDFVLKNNEDDFQSGINILNKLIDSQITLTVASSSDSFFKNIKNVDLVQVSGPHPSANPSVQIQKISPINMGEKVWIIRPEDVVNIGLFFKTGVYQAQRTVAIAGSSLKIPQYFKTKIGANIAPMIKIAGLRSKAQVRCINGDVLSGSITTKDGHIGFYNNLISVIPVLFITNWSCA